MEKIARRLRIPTNINPHEGGKYILFAFLPGQDDQSLYQSGLRMHTKPKRLTGKHLASKMF
jgi:hypothetical protein